MKIIEYQVQRFDLLMDDYHYKVRQGTYYNHSKTALTLTI